MAISVVPACLPSCLSRTRITSSSLICLLHARARFFIKGHASDAPASRPPAESPPPPAPPAPPALAPAAHPAAGTPVDTAAAITEARPLTHTVVIRTRLRVWREQHPHGSKQQASTMQSSFFQGTAAQPSAFHRGTAHLGPHVRRRLRQPAHAQPRLAPDADQVASRVGLGREQLQWKVWEDGEKEGLRRRTAREPTATADRGPVL